MTISRLPFSNDDHHQHRHVKEIDLSPTIFSHPMMVNNNDENELDLTNFVPPPVTRKPPTQHSSNDCVDFRLMVMRNDVLDRHPSETRSSSTVRSNKHSSPTRNEQRK